MIKEQWQFKVIDKRFKGQRMFIYNWLQNSYTLVFLTWVLSFPRIFVKSYKRAKIRQFSTPQSAIYYSSLYKSV
uniref:Transposase n=1 Tax=Panagrellus redivivus TaxID=6233 RepID=A0A7E5A1U1_PANRE